MAKKLTKEEFDSVCFWKSISEGFEKNKKYFDSPEEFLRVDNFFKAEFHKRWDPLDDEQKALVIIEDKRLNDDYEKEKAKDIN